MSATTPVPPFFPPPSPPPPLTAASLRSSPLMLGVYVGIFVLLSAILFVCAVYSCVAVSSEWVGGSWGGPVVPDRFFICFF